MKPFLILQLRKNDEASNGEFEAFLKHGGLTKNEVHRVRMEKAGIPEINLEDYSGVIIGGGPTDVCKPESEKSPEENLFEAQLTELLDEIVQKDFPYLGCCYGLGSLSKHQGGCVSKEKYAETVAAVSITFTEEAEADLLTSGLQKSFRAFVGHKESCQDLPKGAVLLAKGDICPIQMIRLKKNLYGLQFHPELDPDVIAVRIRIYRDAGYFPPEDAESLIETAYKEDITVPMEILRRFVKIHKR